MIESSFRTFLAGEDLKAHRRVKLEGTTVVYATGADLGLGVTEYACAGGDDVTVRLFNAGGTFEMTAADEIPAGATFYAADEGKIGPIGTVAIGAAIEAAGDDDDIIEVLPEADLSATLGNWEFADGDNITLGTDDGTKIGTGADQKIGFWNATPVVQPLHVADPASAGALGQQTLIDNGGGTADTTVDAMTAPVTITDSTGLDATADDTLAATAAPTTLTDNTECGTHDDTVADGSTIGAALTDSTAGTPGDTLNPLIRAAGIHVWAGGAAATDSIDVTGLVDSDLIFLGLQARGTNNPTSVIGTNDSGNDEIDLVLDQNGENGVTRISYLVLITDPKAILHNLIASLAAKINTLRTDNLVQNQNDSDLAQKIRELVTLSGVLGQNESDLGQKMIEIVSWMTVVQDNMKEITTQLAKIKTDVAAVRTGSEANNTAIDAILAQLATTGLQAGS